MQGFNRYYPPDFDYRDKKNDTINKIAGKHALGDRARKLDKGILVVRFELPFNIWCGTCNAHVGMGVRYNAEKKKVGNYYSTPIYAFGCKCHLCSGKFTVQTDPKNSRYVVTEGAKAQVQDWDPEEHGGFPVSYTNPGEGEKEGAAFEKLEKETTSKKRALTAAERLDELEDHNEQRWNDPYSLNRNLRKALREDKGKRREKLSQDTELADRYGLGEGVRLDLVRGDEEKLEGETTAPWLSSSDRVVVKHNAEDEQEWQIAQTKRRRIEMHEQDRKATLSAETGWKDKPPQPTKQATKALIKPNSSNRRSDALSRLSGQLRANSAKKSDPFLSSLSSSSTGISVASLVRRS